MILNLIAASAMAAQSVPLQPGNYKIDEPLARPANARLVWSDEFVVTNKRIIVKTGIFSRKTLEMNLNKIESVNVDQSIFGRMFGYGTITIIGTGGTRESFPDIARAVEFRKRFQEVSS